MKPAGTAADDRYVEHVSLCPQAALAAAGGFIIRGRYSFRARTSHRPRKVIQNDTATRKSVQAEARVADVDRVETELPGPRGIARSVDLRQARQSRPHRVARIVSGNRIQTHQLCCSPDFDLARHQWARADKAHVAAEDVDQLREFVHRGLAKHAPDPRDARVVLVGLARRKRRCVRNHGAELQGAECRAAKAHAVLRKQHRAAVFKLDCRRDHEPQRGRDDEPRPRQQHVERALQHAAVTSLKSAS